MFTAFDSQTTKTANNAFARDDYGSGCEGARCRWFVKFFRFGMVFSSWRFAVRSRQKRDMAAMSSSAARQNPFFMAAVAAALTLAVGEMMLSQLRMDGFISFAMIVRLLSCVKAMSAYQRHLRPYKDPISMIFDVGSVWVTFWKNIL